MRLVKNEAEQCDLFKKINKKSPDIIVRASLFSGGTDGARTRDPLRDRQVF